jgi:hypothetical protein
VSLASAETIFGVEDKGGRIDHQEVGGRQSREIDLFSDLARKPFRSRFEFE